jgi:hypothetical protein
MGGQHHTTGMSAAAVSVGWDGCRCLCFRAGRPKEISGAQNLPARQRSWRLVIFRAGYEPYYASEFYGERSHRRRPERPSTGNHRQQVSA